MNFTDSSTIAFGVFVFIEYWIPVWRVPIQLLLSLAFPLVVYLLFFAQARKHLYLNLSWTVFFMSVFMFYCLYESGPRIGHGNFIWSSYVSVFVLMFASLMFLNQQLVRTRQAGLDDHHRLPSWMSLKFCICFVLFGAHVLYSISYYMRFLTGSTG